MAKPIEILPIHLMVFEKEIEGHNVKARDLTLIHLVEVEVELAIEWKGKEEKMGKMSTNPMEL